MITVGICVLHIHSSVLFKVFRMDREYIYLLPYAESAQRWDRDNILMFPYKSAYKLQETHCPREGGN